MELEQFKELPLLGILRGINSAQVPDIVDVVASAGLKAIEVTLNTENAENIISEFKKLLPEDISIGAGTVLNRSQLDSSLSAGAEFIVSPVYISEVVEYCSRKNIPVFPGALTPQEIYVSWEAGATMVKLFPAKFFGCSYIKELKAPLNDIEILACGGVSADNVAEYFKAGASAVAFGGSIFSNELMNNGDYEAIFNKLDLMICSTKSCLF